MDVGAPLVLVGTTGAPAPASPGVVPAADDIGGIVGVAVEVGLLGGSWVISVDPMGRLGGDEVEADAVVVAAGVGFDVDVLEVFEVEEVVAVVLEVVVLGDINSKSSPQAFSKAAPPLFATSSNTFKSLVFSLIFR